MTPRRFYASDGSPFAWTRLDDRSGIRHPRGCYTAAPDDADVPQLSADVFAAIRVRAEEGERRMEAGDFRGAFDEFVAGLELLPDPREQWNATAWLLVGMGEAAVRAGHFAAAERPLGEAMWSPGTIGNPWVHLRQGQVKLEMGDMERAADELARAYMGGGRDIFAGLDPKYFALVERVLQPPPGMDRLP